MNKDITSLTSQKIEDWLFKGILVTTPLIGYLLAFRYEEGFCSVFKIPTSLISLSLTNIFIGIGALFGILFMLFGTIYFTLRFLPEEKNPVFNSILVLLPGFLLLVVYLILFGKFWREWIWILIVLLFLCFSEFIFPLFTFSKEKNYFEKLKAQRELNAKESTELSDKLEKIILSKLPWKTIYKIFLLFLIILFLALFSYTIGRSQALKQKEFLVSSTPQQLVVLRIYGDTLICAPFNKETKEVNRSFIIFKISDEPKLDFDLEKIGPLHLKNE